ncbi:pentatricopeptide repeat-containing protein At1g15510, chloroplastic-like isoform X2 [Cryptomeria japonica]|uniref:pentatricopeptide repeat-containing protein At1g15510, chloroplastic-like isoform X2 n=1 Tax=Cryptomeria japonica TaxID=3369 RepID=UPI0027DA7CDC|nr:pentatricopeptide repeat-containing protein At1g15510, chloroplastic-like isoform X2 [Cryptomeria japonica]
MATMALALSPHHKHQHNLFNTPLKHPKSRNTKMAFISDIAVFNKRKNTPQKIEMPKPFPKLNTAEPPSKIVTAKPPSKINTEHYPKVITAPAGETISEWGRIQKKTSQRSSKYHKTLTAIYGDMNDLCREGKLKEALRALDDTQFRGGIPVDANMYEILLQACARTKALEQGKQVHAHMRLTRLDRFESLRIRLVKMYASCGSIEDARQVFDETSYPSLQMWNALIRGYVSKGFCEKDALEIYCQMRLAGVKADQNTFSCVLKACGAMSDLQLGKEIHESIVRCKFQSDVVVATALVDMYSKCGAIEDARKVFDKMTQRNVITWTAMISGFTHTGIWDDALDYFQQMQIEGEKPNSITLASVLPACGNTGDLQLGKEIHSYAIRNGFDVYSFVANGLIEMYFNCGQVEAARDIFGKIPERGVVLYSTMIHGCAQNGYANETLEIFRQMNWNGVKPNQFTMMSVLPACGDLGALHKGKELHAYIISADCRMWNK